MQQSPSKHDEFEKAREKFKQGVQTRNGTRYEKLQNADTATAISAAVNLAYNDAKRAPLPESVSILIKKTTHSNV